MSPSRLLLVAATLVAPVVLCTAALAQTVNWDGSASTDWDTNANWDTGAKPTAADSVVNDTNSALVNQPVIGAGVNAVADLLTIGRTSSSATLQMLGGGQLTTTNPAYVGFESGSAGQISMTGAGTHWTAETIALGISGAGALIMTNGATINSSGGVLFGIGEVLGAAPGEGHAVVNGAGTSLTASDITIFNGSLTVQAGGAVSNAQGSLGGGADAEGSALVTGAGSSWTNSGSLIVGGYGHGTVDVEDGGKLSSSAAIIGALEPSVGEVNIAGAGSQWSNSGPLFVGGEITAPGGKGMLTIEDGAALSNGDVTFIGGAKGGAGSVTVSGTGSLMKSAGNFYVGALGTGTVNINDGGHLTTSMNSYIGGVSGTPETNGTGNVIVTGGGAWVNTGDLDIGASSAGSLTIGSGGVVAVSGTTTVAHDSGSTGRLLVDGQLQSFGGVHVNSGGWIGGSGFVSGSATVAGVIAPGNSIGTLTVMGNYIQAPGSTYLVEVDSTGNTDLIAITGMANLDGGTVKVIAYPDFALDTPYTILTAVGGVTGTLEIAPTYSIFLKTGLTYDANSVYLTLSKTSDFSNLGLTPNEIATATGANSLNPGNTLWDALAMLPLAGAPSALDALSGELHASFQTALADDSRFLRDIAMERIRAAFAAPNAAQPPLGYGEEVDPLAPVDPDRFTLWGQPFGSWGHWNTDGNAATMQRQLRGFFAGGDAAIGNAARIGLIAGYSRTSVEIGARASSGGSDDLHLGFYAGTRMGNVELRAGGAYSWHNITTERTVAFPGFSDMLSARYGAQTAQVFGEAGYEIETAIGHFEPFLGLAYVRQHVDGFSETGGAAALTASASSSDAFFTTVGARAESEFSILGNAGKIHGSVGWRHVFGGVTPMTTFNFSGGGPFAIAGVPIARDAAVVDAGLEIKVGRHAFIGLAYNGQIAGNAQDHAVKASLSGSF